MKTEQEQIEQIEKVLKYSVADYKHLKKKGVCYCYAETLIDCGYGDISEYKAEIERLRQEVRDTDKMARNTIEQYRAENEELGNALKQSEDNYNRAFERLKAQQREIERLRTTLGQCNAELNSALESLKSQCREIGKLKAEVKQAQIDILNKVKDIVFDYLGVKNIKEAEALSLLDSTLTYDVVTCGIDELIKEVQDGKDKR